jgi:hypothetical protein
MGNVNPLKTELIVNKNIESVKNSIVNCLKTRNGKIIVSDDDYIECEFGSLLKARMFGEFFIKKETLPRKAEINLEKLNDKKTKINIFIKDTHKYGIKAGYINKYEKVLNKDLDTITNAINEKR